MISKKDRNNSGYTVIEVMIFLVITGILLASSLLVFSGRQARTQFTQAVRETESKISTTVNEVASGYYPNTGDFSCTAGPSGPVLGDVSPKDQGTNKGCIFLGDIISFTKSSNVRLHTVVGLQRTGGANPGEVTSLTEAKPVLISNEAGTGPDNSQNYVMPWGLEVSKIIVPSTICPTGVTSAFGIVLSLGSYSSGDLVSGNQSADLVPLCTSLETGFNLADLKAQTQAMKEADRNPGEVTICLQNSGGGRKAAIVIGSDSNRLNTKTFIDNVPGGC